LEEVGNNGEVAPSFGYSSLKEEIDHLNKSLFVSKELVEESLHPIPWFGCLKNKETSQLLKEYSKSQKKIEEVLRENHFLERVLGKFEGTKFFEIPFNSPLNDLDSEFKKSVNWSFLIAQAINQGLPEHDQEWIESFIKGMQAQENGEVQLSSQQWYHLLDSHREIEKALESKQNLIQCENFFSRLQDKKDLKCLFPGKLYYKIIKEGEGEVVETPFSTVQINYVIKDHLDTILYAVQASETGPIDMSNLIDGMAIGISGMATGEEREIYIHPAFGYGESSNFSPNVGLVAQIKLVGIVTQEKEMDKQPLIPLEISACAMDEAKIIEKEQLLRNEIAFHLGGKTWSHFRKGQKAGYNLDSIIEAFLQENKSEPIADLSFEADELLTALHWRIYHTPDLDSKFVTKG
jgi:FKBP-type peptidyl-prolyl cis-trans isomerase